jgi:hypothetical protein
VLVYKTSRVVSSRANAVQYMCCTRIPETVLYVLRVTPCQQSLLRRGHVADERLSNEVSPEIGESVPLLAPRLRHIALCSQYG